MDRDYWIEILQILVRKPLRTLLASIGIGWGLMMLILLVGLGNGIENGVSQKTRNISMNSMFVWSMGTSLPYAGYQSGRWFKLNNSDAAFLENTFDEIEVVSSRAQLGGYRGTNNVFYKSNTGAFNIYGDTPAYIKIAPQKITAGRYINEVDMELKRKTCVIGQQVVSLLFGEEDPLGKHISINGVNFMVVGTFMPENSGEDQEESLLSIFIPLSTFQKAFKMGEDIGWMSILAKDGVPIESLEEDIINALKQRKQVHPDDKRAFGRQNFGSQAKKIAVMNESIEQIGYIIGAFVLFAGLVGIINIMLVTVKERTREFGVRRALGASPKTILKQIITETLVLTLLSALVGVCMGAWMLEGLGMLLTSNSETSVFSDPSVPLSTVVVAFLLTLFFGALAGLMPALKAVRIKPVDALRANG